MYALLDLVCSVIAYYVSATFRFATPILINVAYAAYNARSTAIKNMNKCALHLTDMKNPFIMWAAW